jgi:hypothetical protein
VAKGRSTFYDVISAAVKDLTEHGFDSVDRVQRWIQEIRAAAERTIWAKGILKAKRLEDLLRDALITTYRRMIDRKEIIKHHPGVSKFTIERLRPLLRNELDRRILASANLIKLNREKAINDTLQRFAGWATSIPLGGGDKKKSKKAKDEVRKSMASLPYVERRVIIDQGHKLTAGISEIIARDGGAIAIIWHSNWRQVGYNYREDHKDRDEKFYALRDSWAVKAGLINKGDGFYEDMTAVGAEINCRCYAQYIYSLGELPPKMLTKKGITELDRVRKAMAA